MAEFSERSVIAVARAVLQESGVLGLVAVILASAMAARYYQMGAEANSGSTFLLAPLMYCLVRIGVLNGMKIEVGHSARRGATNKQSGTGVAPSA